jgi:copper transport protein
MSQRSIRHRPVHLRRAFVLVRAALGLLAVLFAALAVPAGVASAHAIVVDITPADGSALLTPPSEVVVTFSEPMLPDQLSVEVLEGSGRVPPTASAALDPDDPTRVVIHVGPMDDGIYQVRLSGRDVEDLHEAIARTSFAVGDTAPPPSAPVIASFEPLETAARWLVAVALALLVGVTAVRTRWPDVPIARPRRLRRIALAGGALVLVGRLGVLAARTVSLGGDRVEAARTVLGTSEAQRMLLVFVALGCIAVVEQPRRFLWLDVPVVARYGLTCRQALAWLGVGYLAVLEGWGGHSALNGPPEPAMVLAKSAHLLGLGLWIGVLAVALVMSAGAASRRAALAAMSGYALAGALITVVSGLVLSSRLIVSVTALAATPYGVMLMIKLGLIAGAAALGLRMRRAIRSGWSLAELATLSAVVLFGAAMATATPAVDPGFTGAPEPVEPPQPAAIVDDLLVQVRAIPGLPGDNTLELRIADTRRPSPGPVTSVDVRAGGEVSTVVPDDDGLAFVDGVQLPAGESQVDVVANRRGWPDAHTAMVVTTDVPVWRHDPIVSSAAIRWRLIALAVLVAAAGSALLRRRRRTSPVGDAPASAIGGSRTALAAGEHPDDPSAG